MRKLDHEEGKVVRGLKISNHSSRSHEMGIGQKHYIYYFMKCIGNHWNESISCIAFQLIVVVV